MDATTSRPAAATLVAAAVAFLALLVGVSPASAVTAATGSHPAGTTATSEPVGGPRLTGSGLLVDRPADVPAPPSVAAASFVVADAETGAIILARGPHVRRLPASTLKALTALTLLPRLDPAAVHVATQEEANIEGSSVGLSRGGTYTVGQLFQGLMLTSGNDAAQALANHAGGVPQTVRLMQAEADRLGAKDTVVRNPSGLDAPGQLTSAYDLALIARAGLAREDFRRLVATKRVRFPGKPVAGAARPAYEIQSHNRLLYNYPGAIGVKNGFTVAARWTYVGAATRGGRTYIITELTKTHPSWRYTAAVLDWAFAYGHRVRPVGHLVDPAPQGDDGGADDSQDEPAGAPVAPAVTRASEAESALPASLRVVLWTLGTLAAAVVLLRVRVVVRRRLRRARRVRASARPAPR